MQLTKLFILLALSSPAFSHLRPKYLVSRQNDTSISVAPNAAGSSNNQTIIQINDNQTSTNPLDIQCAKVTKLSALSSLSTNATLLDMVIKRNNLTQAQASALKSQADSASTEVNSMESASPSLAPTCATSNRVSRECAQLKGLSALEATTADPAKLSALQQSEHLTLDQIAELQMAATNSEPLLMTLEANQTLVDECSTFEAARSAGSGIADAAVAAVAAVGSSNSGAAAAANGTSMGNETAGAAAASGTGSAGAVMTAPPKSISGAGQNEGSALGLVGSVLLVALGMVLFA